MAFECLIETWKVMQDLEHATNEELKYIFRVSNGTISRRMHALLALGLVRKDWDNTYTTGNKPRVILRVK